MTRLRHLVHGLLLTGCVPDQPTPDAFTRGQIVQIRVSGQKVIVTGRTNRPFMYEEKYDVKGGDSTTMEIYPFETEPQPKP